MNEMKIKQEKLLNKLQYSLGMQIIDCERHKFDIWKRSEVIANVSKQFMSVHRYMVRS